MVFVTILQKQVYGATYRLRHIVVGIVGQVHHEVVAQQVVAPPVDVLQRVAAGGEARRVLRVRRVQDLRRVEGAGALHVVLGRVLGHRAPERLRASDVALAALVAVVVRLAV